MKRYALFLLLTATLFAQHTSLTPKEISDGWVLLFDGETLFGWTPEGKAQWRASGGVLTAEGENGWLRSNAAFADFEMKCDWRTGADGNSGVFLRSAKDGAPHETGYELQIWNQHPKYATGSLVNHVAAKRIRPAADRWHTFEVQAVGSQWVVKVDGKKVLDASDPKSKTGHFGLQYNKDKKIEFRNIKVRPLGLKPIFNGKNLDGWKVVEPPKPPKERAVWSAKDGMINVLHGGGQLETESTWDDFILQLDIRANSDDPKRHPNSGIFFRGDPGAYWAGYESQIRNEYKDNDPTQPVDYGTGAIYNRIAARKIVAADNQFFTKTLIARGAHMSVWINGYQVTDWEDTRPPDASARKGLRTKEGTIALQAHDPTTNLDFRNIRIAPFPK
ncbi:MAG TPA: DUF1080 domain-containing protein [Bryobacteraceae bacterium]|nr:DUF1080 domain-containing protein [Bryobacteraceae bacterium]